MEATCTKTFDTLITGASYIYTYIPLRIGKLGRDLKETTQRLVQTHNEHIL